MLNTNARLDNRKLNSGTEPLSRRIEPEIVLASQNQVVQQRLIDAIKNPFERMFNSGFAIKDNIHRINLERGDGPFSFIESGLPGLARTYHAALDIRKAKAFWDYMMQLAALAQWQHMRFFLVETKETLDKELSAIDRTISKLQKQDDPQSLKDLIVAKWKRHELRHVRDDIDELEERAERTQLPPSQSKINDYQKAAETAHKRTQDIVETGLRVANDSKSWVFGRAAAGCSSLAAWLKHQNAARPKPTDSRRHFDFGDEDEPPQTAQNNNDAPQESSRNDNVLKLPKPPEKPDDSDKPDDPELV